jgi:hypothetical protein
MTPENSILRHVLRILTPEEIEDLTREFVSFNKVKLTDVLELELNIDDEEARGRILKKGRQDVIENLKEKAVLKDSDGSEDTPETKEETLEGKSEQEVQSGQDKDGDKDKKETKKDPERTKEAAQKAVPKRKLGPLEQEAEIIEEVIGGNEFILGEKEKLKDSNWKLKGQSLLALYEKNASIDLEHEKANNKKNKKENKGGSGSSQSGVLIDKDHQ